MRGLYSFGRDGEGLPRFVEEEFRDFLQCGWLAGGFARFWCGTCGLDRLVPFSCKGRGFCPRCGGRRMAERAAHLRAVLGIEEAAAIDRILRHLGLPTTIPAARPARAPPLPAGVPDTGWDEATLPYLPRGGLRRRLGLSARRLAFLDRVK